MHNSLLYVSYNLHSTIFILKHASGSGIDNIQTYLHSTIFILKHLKDVNVEFGEK